MYVYVTHPWMKGYATKEQEEEIGTSAKEI